MSKYILDTDHYPFVTDGIMAIGFYNGVSEPTTFYESLENIEELTADYINEHYGDLQDDAYERGHGIGYKQGYEDGKKEAESSEAIEQAKADAFNKGMLFKNEKIHDAYQRGLDDAWKCAKKIVSDEENGGMGGVELMHVFNRICIDKILKDFTAEEAIDKIKVYEHEYKQDKYLMGDEVVDENGIKGIVVSSENDEDSSLYVLFNGCRVPQNVTQNFYKKTGKHYDINKYLDEMKGTGADDDTH